jgi:hypothetical protein
LVWPARWTQGPRGVVRQALPEKRSGFQEVSSFPPPPLFL